MISAIAGLGNPGLRYRKTRHNLGFRVVDALAKDLKGAWRREERFQARLARIRIGGAEVTVIKPQTFMNESGRSLHLFCDYYRFSAEQLAVIYDEVNIELGQVKISLGGSPGGHNGVENVLRYVGEGFVRFRLGIGPKSPNEIGIKDFVLGKFTRHEQSVVNKKMPEYLAGLHLLVDRGPVMAMNQMNRRKNTKEEVEEIERSN